MAKPANAANSGTHTPIETLAPVGRPPFLLLLVVRTGVGLGVVVVVKDTVVEDEELEDVLVLLATSRTRITQAASTYTLADELTVQSFIVVVCDVQNELASAVITSLGFGSQMQ